MVGSTPSALTTVARKSGTVTGPSLIAMPSGLVFTVDRPAFDAAAAQDGTPGIGEVVAALLRLGKQAIGLIASLVWPLIELVEIEPDATDR